jgi:Holliday junction DNA helicase RuvB
MDANDLIRRAQPAPAPDETTDESVTENKLRPVRFEDFIGQERLKENLSVFVESAKARGEALDHVLLAGPPGLGKTTLAHIIATYMGSSLHACAGPAIERKGDLAGILTKLKERDVLFIDEIHRLNAAVEETLYPAMEDFTFDLIMGEGPHSASVQLPIKPFTLVGATTRSGLLTSPLRDRFGIVFRLEFYPANELKLIVLRSASVLNVPLYDEAAYEIARRSRGTPRIANRLLRRVSDFALFKAKSEVDVELARYALDRLDVDEAGLDRLDHRYLEALISKFQGGPTGIDTLAAALGEDRTTLEDVVEPYLLQEGFLQRTPRGRIASGPAYRALGLVPRTDQGELL